MLNYLERVIRIDATNSWIVYTEKKITETLHLSCFCIKYDTPKFALASSEQMESQWLTCHPLDCREELSEKHMKGISPSLVTEKTCQCYSYLYLSLGYPDIKQGKVNILI
jgi:hypothetical protein